MLGGHWDDEGSIVIGSGGEAGLRRLPSTGGASTPILELAKGELFHTNPQILPGGKAILLEAVGSPSQDDFTIEVVSIADRVRKTLARGVGLLVTCPVAISCTRRKRRCSPCRSTSSGWKHEGLPSRFLTTSRTTR